jgi:Tol biopolymer transport system component
VSLSADGRYAAFDSSATNLVANDTNINDDIFVRDRVLGITSRVSVSSGGTEATDYSRRPKISWDGRNVVFQSAASNLVADDTNIVIDIFVHDRVTGETSRVSVSSGGTESNDGSYNPAISGNGRYAAFDSVATNLVANDTNGQSDIFVRDLWTGATTRVSVSSGGTPGNGWSYNPDMSYDGRFVVFHSEATNLVANDNGGQYDIFVHDQKTGETSLVSVSSGGTQGDTSSFNPAISADGRYVAFHSAATNLVADDANGNWDVFLHDRQTQETTRVSVTSGGTECTTSANYASISANGRYVFFTSGSHLDSAYPTSGPSIFVHDNVTGETRLASKNAAGDHSDMAADSASPAVSANGNYVLFASQAANLVADDTNGAIDVFAAPNPALP